MKAGDCFWGDPNGGTNNHLFIALTDPSPTDGKMVWVNFTSAKGGKYSCSVPGGYHWKIVHQSDLNFMDAHLESASLVDSRIQARVYESGIPLPHPKLLFLQLQAKASTVMAKNLKDRIL
jgi:hypothetical protein